MQKNTYTAISALVVLGVLSSTFPAYAQSSLQEQIADVQQAQTEQHLIDDAAIRAASAEQRRREAKLEAARASKNAKLAQAKQRDESYEDKLRDMQLESMKLDLQAKGAVVKRSNDYIDQDLKRENATTDVIQSHADATRAIAGNVKNTPADEPKGFWSSLTVR